MPDDPGIGRLLQETVEAVIWRGQPTLYENSIHLALSRRIAFAPESLHPRADEVPGNVEMVNAIDLVRRQAELDGLYVGLIGHILAEESFPEHNGLANRIFQVVSKEDPYRGPLVYCRGTVEAGKVFDRKNMLFAATGVVIAGGTVRTQDGGTRPGAYMLASFVGEFPQVQG